jgi:hypothetical protein
VEVKEKVKNEASLEVCLFFIAENNLKFFRFALTIFFAVVAFVALIHGQEAPVTPETDTGSQIKEGAKKAYDATVDGAKKVGTKIADGASAGYDATKNYLNNKTVGDIGGDVVDGVKAGGTAVVEGSKSLWSKTKDTVSGWFS